MGKPYSQLSLDWCSVDYSWHTNYTPERQRWQDSIVSRTVSRDRNDDDVGQSWIVFTAGAMGAGKGYAMKWLSTHGIVELVSIHYPYPALNI